MTSIIQVESNTLNSTNPPSNPTSEPTSWADLFDPPKITNDSNILKVEDEKLRNKNDKNTRKNKNDVNKTNSQKFANERNKKSKSNNSNINGTNNRNNKNHINKDIENTHTYRRYNQGDREYNNTTWNFNSNRGKQNLKNNVTKSSKMIESMEGDWKVVEKKKPVAKDTKRKGKQTKNVKKKSEVEVIKFSADELKRLKEKSNDPISKRKNEKKTGEVAQKDNKKEEIVIQENDLKKGTVIETLKGYEDTVHNTKNNYDVQADNESKTGENETENSGDINKISKPNGENVKKKSGKRKRKAPSCTTFTEILCENVEVSIPSSEILQHLKVSEIKPLGLSNLTNTCFMSSSIQALIHLPHFQTLLPQLYAKHLVMEKYPFFYAFWKLIQEMKKSKSAVSPTELVSLLGNSQTLMQIGVDQNDAHEFLLLILDLLHKELIPGSSGTEFETIKREDEGWEEVGKANKSSKIQKMSYTTSSISTIFSGTMRCLIRKRNEKGNLTLQPFYSLHIPIEGVTSLKEALANTFARESVNFETYQEFSLEKLPPVLMLHLNRFAFDTETHKTRKISNFISFEESLFIDETILAKSKSPLQSNERKYTLHSVIQHHGNDIDSGHYTSLVRFGKDEWYNFNDENVSKYTTKECLQAQAYLLIYIRGD